MGSSSRVNRHVRLRELDRIGLEANTLHSAVAANYDATITVLSVDDARDATSQTSAYITQRHLPSPELLLASDRKGRLSLLQWPLHSDQRRISRLENGLVSSVRLQVQGLFRKTTPPFVP